MSVKVLRGMIDELISQLERTEGEEAIAELCRPVAEWLEAKGYKTNTVLNYLSQTGYYKRVKEDLPHIDGVTAYQCEIEDGRTELRHYARKYLGLTPEEITEANATTRVTTRATSQGSEIDPKRYLARAAQLLKSHNPRDVAVGLIAATGRRPIEILFLGSFAEVPGEEFCVEFNGQAKKRGKGRTYRIPTFFSSWYLVERLNFVQDDPRFKELGERVIAQFPDDPSSQNDEIENSAGSTLRAIAHREFHGKQGENFILDTRAGKSSITLSSFRPAWAALATHETDGSLLHKIYRAGVLLGHIQDGESKDDGQLRHLQTTIGYGDYYIPKKFGDVARVTVPRPEPEPTPKTNNTKPQNVRIDPRDKARFDGMRRENNQATGFKMLLDRWEATGGDTLTDTTELKKKVARLEQKLAETRDELSRREAELELERQKRWAIEHQKTAKQETETMTPEQIQEFVNESVSKALAEALKGVVASPTAEPTAESEPPEPAPEPTPKAEPTRAKLIEADPELMELPNGELWERRDRGAAPEKIARTVRAIMAHNDETPDPEMRIAPTNAVIREISGTNGQTVSAWVKAHSDEILYHYSKYGMGDSLTTYFNRGKDIEAVTGQIKADMGI